MTLLFQGYFEEAPGLEDPSKCAGAVVDVGGCTVQMAVLVVITWVSHLAELSKQGNGIEADTVSIITGRPFEPLLFSDEYFSVGAVESFG